MSTEMLSEESIRKFVAAWYLALDQHAPAETCWSFLADNGLKMVFPDGDITDFDTFKLWYQGKGGPGGEGGVINIFFDENHTVQSVRSEIRGDQADLDVVVGWQASWFVRGEAKSHRTSMNATQTWTVRRSAKNAYGLEIVTYNATAKPFEYAPGFAQL